MLAVHVSRNGGVPWTLRVEGATRVVSVEIYTQGTRLEHQDLREVPLSKLTDLALNFARDVEEFTKFGGRMADALDDARIQNERTLPGSGPALSAFRRWWNGIGERIDAGQLEGPRRAELASVFDVSESTIDLWTRLARDNGAIPEATRGRPRKGVEGRLQARKLPKKPTSEQVADHLREGLDRHQLAKRYSRSVITVDGWIRQAREEFPDLPQRAHGPRSTAAGGGETT